MGSAADGTRGSRLFPDADIPPDIDLEGRKCAVTGAGGFIGQAVSTRLGSAGADVAGLEVDPGAAARVAGAGASFVQCDTTDRDSVRRALDGVELVVHTAARVSDWGPVDDFVRVNVGGTENVLDAAHEAGCQQIVHVSSVAIWGYEHTTDLDEDASPRPCGIPYIDTKGESDSLALGRARAGEPVAIVRPGDVYGPGSTQWAVRPLEGIRRRRFTLVGKGDGIMTPVYIDDLVEGIVLALVNPEARGLAFTVWDGQPVTVAEFFDYYARMLGRERLPRLPRPLAMVAGGAQELAARLTGKPPTFTRNAITFVSRKASYSNRRAREVLGWEPRVALDEGMRRTEAWFRSEGLLS